MCEFSFKDTKTGICQQEKFNGFDHESGRLRITYVRTPPTSFATPVDVLLILRDYIENLILSLVSVSPVSNC